MAGFLIVAGTLLSYAIAWVLDIAILVPFLNTAASFPFMVLALKRGDMRMAIARMLLWALTMGVCATSMSYARPAATDGLFLRGEAYRTEMFAWVMTGRGVESTPSQFIPQQAGHAALFMCVALATGGVAAMPMGAVLMNDMGHYVGTLAAKSAHPALTMVLAWHPWAVIRVVSFVVLGVVLSIPVLSGLGVVRAFNSAVSGQTRSFAAWACAGLVADIVLKALIAPTWQRLLLRSVGW
jgi:hypothetical protein